MIVIVTQLADTNNDEQFKNVITSDECTVMAERLSGGVEGITP